MKTKNVYDDDFIKLLLSSGINLEYYDHVFWSKEYITKAVEAKSFEFWYSGITITLSNGTKRTILFIWEKYYKLETAKIKMMELLINLSSDFLEELSKRSLKQTLKRLRRTNINVN